MFDELPAAEAFAIGGRSAKQTPVQIGPSWSNVEPSCLVTVRIGGGRNTTAESNYPRWGGFVRNNKKTWTAPKVARFDGPDEVWDHYKDRAAPLELARLALLIDQSHAIRAQNEPKKRRA